MSKTSRRPLSFVILLILVAVLVGGWLQRYNIYDWLRLRNYTPPAEIAQLATDTSMTERGRRLFYVNHPVLNDEITFQENCTVDEVTIVLGCYVGGKGIFLFKVTDERLSGVHQVTAAHELLHAAYDRLSASEREEVDRLTKEAYEALTDQRIINTVAAYEARDSSVVPNELHSILATEVESLPAALEDYYKKYFDDRSIIVKFSKAYEAAFEERRQKVVEYDRQLSDLKQRIDEGNADLAARERQIASARAELDAMLANNQVEEYNARVPGFNAQVRSYNAKVNEVRGMIDQYNALIIERNAIALEQNELLDAIDSRPDTLPAH